MVQIPDPETRALSARLEDGTVLPVTELSFTESLCESYSGEAVLLARGLDSESLIGQPFAVRYTSGMTGKRKATARYFHGLVATACNTGYSRNGELQTWKVTFRPWLWLLSMRVNCRIFQNLSSQEIIDKLLQEHGLKGSYRFNNRSKPPRREYCVQYNESDGAFINRLLRQDSLHYFFEHKADGHCMVISDNNHTFSQCNPNVGHYIAAANFTDAVQQWQPARNIGPLSHCTRGYEPDQASPTDSGSTSAATRWSSGLQMDCHLFDPACLTLSDSRRLNTLQAEASDAKGNIVYGESSQAGFCTGGYFRLEQHPDKKQTGDYLLLSVSHRLIDTAESSGIEYRNSFTCMPLETPYRPPLVPAPKITSLQSARVCGPDNSELHTDGKGAIKVRFHWDKDDNKDEEASCWLRVMQPLCGNGFGFQVLPRVGDEVLIGFIDGCPDLPMVLGSAWNGQHKTPFDTAEICGLISRSTTQGGSDEGSHLLFDDRRKEEKVQLKSQKDLEVEVLNDRSTRIGNDDTLAITGKADWHADKAIAVSTDETWDLKAKQDMSFSTDASGTIKASSNLETSAGSSQKHSANNEMSFDATSIKMSAKTKIELSVGGSKVTIAPDSVKIEAPQVSINGQMRAEMKSVMATIEGSAMTEVKGLMVSVNGNTMTEIKGAAMVKIQGGLAMIN
ncbi:type VI secretion system Vgr family protein [Spongorhabdus nitratireducens]